MGYSLLQITLTRENIKSTSSQGLSEIEAKAKVQILVDEVVTAPLNLILVFLPESDRGKDDSDGNSIYAFVYSRLLRRKIASQVIYENTILPSPKVPVSRKYQGNPKRLIVDIGRDK